MMNRKLKYGLTLSAMFAASALIWPLSSPSIDSIPKDAKATTDFQTQKCDYKVSSGDLSIKELKNGKILPAKCYQDALYYGRENAIISVERGFTLNKIPENIAQDIRNQALLYSARVSLSIKKIDMAVKYGADINLKNKKGESLAEMILKTSLQSAQWDLLLHLHNEYQYDLHEITNTISGVNLLHIAAKSGSYESMKYIKEQKLSFNEWDKRGNHALDYATPEFAKIMTEDFGITRHGTPPDILPTSAYARAYLKENNRAYIDFTKKAENLTRPRSDFSVYSPIKYDRRLIPDNAINPALIIAEYAPLSFGSGEHIQDTTRVAMGVKKRLGSKKWSDVISIEENPAAYNDGSLTNLLRYNISDYLIISNSIGSLRVFKDKTVAQEYRSGPNFMESSLSNVDELNFIYYNSAGNENDGKGHCLNIDNIAFCLQNDAASYHPLNAVRVGAAHKINNDQIIVDDYSNMRPTFCALLPYNNGFLYAGTSFSAPAAAAVEERLADIFARSAALPNGVVHEDILMALMLTAKSEGLVDEKTGRIVPVYQNIAGFLMNDRCGAGVIQEQKAADLLSNMVRWTRNNPEIIPTKTRSVHIKIEADEGQTDKNRITYNLTVPQDGVLTQMRAGLVFAGENKGAALIQIGKAPPLPLDLSSSGLTTEFRFAGHKFKAGDKIKLITTRPLKEKEYDWQAENFIDLRMVQKNSPIVQAINSTVLSK